MIAKKVQQDGVTLTALTVLTINMKNMEGRYVSILSITLPQPQPFGPEIADLSPKDTF